MDKRPELNNGALEALMLKMKREKTTEAQDEFLNTLLRSQLVLPVTIDPPPTETDEQGRSRINKNSKFTFHLMKNDNGVVFYPTFTNWDEIRKGPHSPTQNTIVLPFKDIASLVVKNPEVSDGFVINPFGESVVVHKPLIEHVLKVVEDKMKEQRPTLQQVATDEQVKLGDFGKPPQDMLDALTKFFDETFWVRTAYLLAMMQGDKTSFLLVLDYEGDTQTVFTEVGRVMKPFAGGKGISVTDVNTPLGKKAMIGRFPFYDK